MYCIVLWYTYNLSTSVSNSRLLKASFANKVLIILIQQIELENTLEQEQEALVNKLWKRMDKLEAEKR